MRIGIDFDNTIAGYDHLFLTIAQEKDWLPHEFSGAKKAVRDLIRTLPDGELTWMELQAIVYGARMAEARIIEGVEAFLLECRQRGVPVHIVSHKARHAARDPLRVDLHAVANEWLNAQGFSDRFGVGSEMVFFEPTRQDKCRRIGSLGCSHFIDDLEEVFHDPSFPDNTAGYLLSAEATTAPRAGCKTFSSWRDIHDDIFGHH